MALMKENESNKKGMRVQTVLGILLCCISMLYLAVSCWGVSGIAMLTFFYDVPTLITYTVLCVGCLFLSGHKTKRDRLAFLQKVSIPNGALIAVIQFVFVLTGLDDVSALGPSAAVSLLVLVYSLVLYVVVTILKVRCEKEVLD